MLAALGWGEYERGDLCAYLSSNMPVHLHMIGAFERLYLILRDSSYTSALGDRGYLALPASVRLWAPDELKERIMDEHGRPGNCFLVEYDGRTPLPDGTWVGRPDGVWLTCTRCGASPSAYDGTAKEGCPECGWVGNKEEQLAFEEYESKYAERRNRP